MVIDTFFPKLLMVLLTCIALAVPDRPLSMSQLPMPDQEGNEVHVQPAAQRDENHKHSVSDELEQMRRPDLLPEYRPGTMVEQISSYDTTGGNDDGFSGRFSYLRKEGSNLVIADIEGPGVINRIWTPTPTDDTLQFFIDGERTPSISIRFSDLFSGKVFPFLEPVVGNELGGYYCYLPVTFAKSCKILFLGERIMFHQVQYRRYMDEVPVERFPIDWSLGQRKALDETLDFWHNHADGLKYAHSPTGASWKEQERSIQMKPGQATVIFTSDRGGRIRRMEFAPAKSLGGLNKDILIKATWDDEHLPAIYCPLADFFGFAFGRPSMNSMLLGTSHDTLYSNMPMPFDEGAKIELIYQERPGAVQPEVTLASRVSYTSEARQKEKEGKFYTCWRRDLPKPGISHTILEHTGRGHYMGTTLWIQGLNPGMTLFFEGDDSLVVDGQMRIHGTGSEDYFNGGWYALPNRWDRGISLAVHGSLDYSIPYCRTGGYRFYLADKLPFDKHLLLTMEHGPVNDIPSDYTSLAFYYADDPPASITAPNPDNTAMKEPNAFVFTPDLLRFTPAIGTVVNHEDWNGVVITGEEEGLIKIYLDELDPGAYEVYISYYAQKSGAAFSLWKRQQSITKWISSSGDSTHYVKERYMGIYNLDAQDKSITLKVQGEGNTKQFKLDELLFKRQ